MTFYPDVVFSQHPEPRSVSSLPHGSEAPHPRSFLRAALKIAGRGVPVFPCRQAPDKSPLTPHGFKDASRDRSRVTALWNAHTRAAIATPTGEKFWVLDVDDLGALAELEAMIGPLPATLIVRTPSGGLHLYFRAVEGVTNRRGSLPDGIDVRGEGGYVLLPPSIGYTYETRAPIADAPEALLEIIRKRKPTETGAKRSASTIPDGETILKGRRNNTLASICGRLHDGTRDLPQLTADLLAENEARCTPPLPAWEVEKIARSIYNGEPFRPRGSRDPEVARHIRELERYFWEQYGENFKGLPGQSDRDLLRVSLDFADQFGRINDEGRVEFDMTAHKMGLAAGISRNCVNTAAKRLREKVGLTRNTRKRSSGKAGKWILPDPAQLLSTPTNVSSGKSDYGGIDKGCAPPRVVGLETPCYRHFGIVNKGRGGVKLALEAFGPMSAEDLACVFGIARARDVKRRYMDGYWRKKKDGTWVWVAGMIEEGQVVERDGIYSLPEDHIERCEREKNARYSNVLRRKVRSYSHAEGRYVTEVVEVGAEASENERDEMARRAYADAQKAWREELKRRSPEGDDECQEVLTSLYKERDETAEASVSDVKTVELRRRRRDVVSSCASLLKHRADLRGAAVEDLCEASTLSPPLQLEEAIGFLVDHGLPVHQRPEKVPSPPDPEQEIRQLIREGMAPDFARESVLGEEAW